MLVLKGILLVFLGVIGGLPTIGIVGGLIGTIIYKFYRKSKYHISLFD